MCYFSVTFLSKKSKWEVLFLYLVDRGSKRRQVKPLADSLLDVLDYDSSDDSDFEVGDASGKKNNNSTHSCHIGVIGLNKENVKKMVLWICTIMTSSDGKSHTVEILKNITGGYIYIYTAAGHFKLGPCMGFLTCHENSCWGGDETFITTRVTVFPLPVD